jgi:hypothetical protein
MNDMDLVSVFSYIYPVFLATLVKETVFSTSYVLGSIVKNHVAITVGIHIWVFYSVPLVFLSLTTTLK